MLKLTKPMMHGPAVRRLQEQLDLAGFDYGPNDGIFGPQTEGAVKAFQKSFVLFVDGVYGPRTKAALFARLKMEPTILPSPVSSVIPGRIFDYRDNPLIPRLYRADKSPREEINGVTIHQTGCDMPDDPYLWRNLNAHIGVLRNGAIVIAHDPFNFIWHAQGLSHKTIGIEIEGNFPGLIGDLRTLWKGGGGPHYLTTEQKHVLPILKNWLDMWFKGNGFEWETIHVHRQASKDRPADPGQEIWEYIRDKWFRHIGSFSRGMGNPDGKIWDKDDGGPEFFVGTGQPIPWQWWGDYEHDYWEEFQENPSGVFR